jgi:hypothetical protein
VQGFIKVKDKTVYEHLLKHGIMPFNASDGVYIYSKSDRIMELLNSEFGEGSFIIDRKLVFGGGKY